MGADRTHGSRRERGALGTRSFIAIVLLATASGPGLTQNTAPPPAGATYVAIGSSFAAGPGITVPADAPPDRCARSADNYAHQIARRHDLRLLDVSCSGATTAHVLGEWNTLAPQLDAVGAETRLVTVTIGGNDVRLIADALDRLVWGTARTGE